MSDIKKPSMARIAVDTIKEAKEAGEEIGRMVAEIQAENERSVRQYQARVLAERQEQRIHERELDQIAMHQWIAEEQRQQHQEKVRQDVERTYGRGSWDKIQATKTRIKQLEAQDLQAANELRNRMNDLLWWCIGIAALLTYAFKLYK
jgi:phage terminase Nu1 subunit (DNA packaging protein)